jgi:hypothetical protein
MATFANFAGGGRDSDAARLRLLTAEVKATALKCLVSSFGSEEPSFTIAVFEMQCPTEGCDDMETVIMASDARSRPDDGGGGGGSGGGGGAALSIKLRIRRPLQEVRECDVKASIAEWQQHREGAAAAAAAAAVALPLPIAHHRSSAGVADAAAAAGEELEGRSCSCCVHDVLKQREGCNCCGWRLMEDGSRVQQQEEEQEQEEEEQQEEQEQQVVEEATEEASPEQHTDANDGADFANADAASAMENTAAAPATTAAPTEGGESVTITLRDFYGGEWILGGSLHAGSTLGALKQEIACVTGAAATEEGEGEEVRLLFEGRQLPTAADGVTATLGELRIGCDGNAAPVFLVRRRRHGRR